LKFPFSSSPGQANGFEPSPSEGPRAEWGHPDLRGVWNFSSNVQILQNRDTAVILTETIHDARIVPIGERPPLDGNIGLWCGDSRGYYDGDTLVVETRNFNGLTQIFNGFGHSVD